MAARTPEMRRACPQCKILGPARLAPGEVCATCRGDNAWKTLGETGVVVIDRASIDAAVRRRAGQAGEAIWRRMLAWAPLAVTLGIAAIAAVSLVDLLSSRPIGPLDDLLADLAGSVGRTAGFGALAVVAGVVAFVRMRQRRPFRRIAMVTGHASAIVIGATALAVGGLAWLGMRDGFAGRYTTMPTRDPLAAPSPAQRILDATVVVLAPGADGDARELAIGTGAIVASEDSRAWVVTCSHVAMPYAAVGAFRDPRAAQPVWIQVSDGRAGQGVVRWAAAPPLDVALVEIAMDHPPRAVAIAGDTSALDASTGLMFVPNPYRDGWKVVRGRLIRRDKHRTPAGAYDLLFTDLPVVHGDSGSGLYDAGGQLVGLNTWTILGGGPAQGISLPSETMRELIDAIGSGSLDKLPR